MLMQRIITAIILIPITLLILFYSSPYIFFLVTLLVSLAAAWEWSNLMGLKKMSGRVIYLLLSGIIYYWVSYNIFNTTIPVTLLFALTFVWWLFATALIVTYPRGSEWWSNSITVRGIMGLLVLVPCWIGINVIWNQRDGVYMLLFLFVLIWGADSAAYFVGRKWGKDKLAPLVSPGKSQQGLYGALIFSSLIALIALYMSHTPFILWPWAIALSLITVIFSVIGDLFESMMKRQAGLKDSGKLLPGHGGLLDRIDSLTAAVPVFVLGGLLLGMYLN